MPVNSLNITGFSLTELIPDPENDSSKQCSSCVDFKETNVIKAEN
jgi:hypothetical protein